jgi:hypothetical protein
MRQNLILFLTSHKWIIFSEGCEILNTDEPNILQKITSKAWTCSFKELTEHPNGPHSHQSPNIRLVWREYEIKRQSSTQQHWYISLDLKNSIQSTSRYCRVFQSRWSPWCKCCSCLLSNLSNPKQTFQKQKSPFFSTFLAPSFFLV